jgi:hypothetical protein
MWINSSYFIHPSAHVLHLSSNPLLYWNLHCHLLITQHGTAAVPQWLLSLSPGVCWPSHWWGTPNSSIRLIESHQIISKTINNIILLLSFGLCSPVLCGYIAVSICIHLCGWLILIGRFVFVRIDALNVSRSSSHPIDRGS